MARLPVPGGDENTWGTVLNDFLAQAHNSDGTIKDGAITGLQGRNVSAAAPSDGDVLTYDTSGSQWIPQAPTVPSIDDKADDDEVVHLTGNESIDGTKTFTSAPNVPDSSFTQAKVTNLTTDLAAKQPLDSDLTAIAGLSPTNDDIIQRKAGAWTNRTPAQLKLDLSLTKSDVGLGNVDNTSDANKPISSATQTALNAKADDSALTAHINDASDAHDASAISFSPTGTIAATDVQAAVAEASGDLTTHAAAPLGSSVHGVREVHWREENVAAWTQHVMSTDATVTNTQMLVVDGQCWIYGTGGSATTSVRRDLWVIPGTETWTDMEVMGLWWGGPIQNGSGQPQHGFGLRVKNDGGVSKAVMVWHDTFIGIPSMQNCAVWWSGQTIPTADAVDAGIRAVSSGSRTSELTTLTLTAGHRLWPGQIVRVSMADSGYNGQFPIESVTATTITYRQSGAANDAASGAGTVTTQGIQLGSGTDSLVQFNTISGATRTDGVVVATVPADHQFAVGDRIVAEFPTANAFDGAFIVSAVTDTTVSWGQAGSDGSAGEAGTITKTFPYIMRARLVGQHVDFAWSPYQGVGPATAVLMGQAAFGDPRWSASYDLSTLVGTGAAPTGQGGVALLAGHVGSVLDGASNPTHRCVYGPIVARKLS